MKQLEYFENFFDEYTTSFDIGSDKVRSGIQTKKLHSMEVYKFARRICDSLKLNEADYIGSMTAALFHDIGRFEQFKQYKTYIDRDSVNHATRGVKVLRKLDVLKDFDTETRKDILCAVACHNKPHLPEHLSERATLFCNIARDADKLDIFRVVIEVYESGIHDPVILLNLEETDVLSPEVVERVVAGDIVLYNKMKTTADFKMVQLGWFDELCFSKSLRIARSEGFADSILSSMPDSLPIQQMRQKINAKFAKVRT